MHGGGRFQRDPVDCVDPVDSRHACCAATCMLCGVHTFGSFALAMEEQVAAALGARLRTVNQHMALPGHPWMLIVHCAKS